MSTLSTLSLSFLTVCLVSVLVVHLTSSKEIAHKDELRVGIIGALFFGFIAWACIYMAQIKPFIDPKTSD
jgi:hypothetical protein